MYEPNSVLGVPMDWLAYMPSASATGTVTIGGTTATLGPNAIGYHDHNYGVWLGDEKLGSTFNYKWAQYSDPRAAVAVAYAGGTSCGTRSCPAGYLFIRLGAARAKIQAPACAGDVFNLTALALLREPGGCERATSVMLQAENAEWRAE
eukprot:gene4234-9116_t